MEPNLPPPPPPAKLTASTVPLLLLGNTQFLVTTATALAILHIRTAHSLYFGLGTLVAAFIGSSSPPAALQLPLTSTPAKLLKRFIRQPRPVGAKKFERTYGMPSTHSSSIAFFGTYLSLSSLLLPRHPRVTDLLPFWSSLGELGQQTTRVGLAGVWIAGAGTVCWSRVRLGHHTPAQVLVGATLGSAVAVVWLSLWVGLKEVGVLREMEGMPGWLWDGFKEQGILWERAVEDAIFAAVEEGGGWQALKALRGFPVVATAGDEL